MSAAAASAFVMMLYSPYSVFSAGFRMSYLAVFSMSMLMPYAEKISGSKLFSCFAPVLAVQIGMAPFTAYVFNYFSLSAFPANIPIVFLAGIMQNGKFQGTICPTTPIGSLRIMLRVLLSSSDAEPSSASIQLAK